MQFVNSIVDLETLTGVAENDMVYVNYHTVPWDGGGGYFTLVNKSRIVKRDGSTRSTDGGIIIKSNLITTCFWLRDIPGEINVRFYGPYDTNRIQKAVDYAAENYLNNIATHGSTVFLPGMQYDVSGTITLKQGVSLRGESMLTTIIKASVDNSTDYLIKIESGRIDRFNISDITFNGGIPPILEDGSWTGSPASVIKGCMLFEATSGEYDDGGIWYGIFKNITIKHFNGDGIVFLGGTSSYNIPHQCCIFENVVVARQKDAAKSLVLNGEIGQFTFINSAFGGHWWGSGTVRQALKGVNCYLGNETGVFNHGLSPTVVTFLNCTFQDAEYAVKVKWSDAVTFDNCWFENLDFSFFIENMDDKPSHVNILNSFFANAASFGSYTVLGEHTSIGGDYPGACIVTKGSYINVHNNRIVASSYSANDVSFNKYFILALDGNKGVCASGNTFGHPLLGLTSGITQTISTIDAGMIEAYGNTTNMLSFTSSQIISTINSTCLSGERIVFKVRPGISFTITFNVSGNIRLGTSSSLVVTSGQIVEFVKTDSNVEGSFYQLTSIY